MPCLGGMLLYNSACGTEGISHTGLGKKDLGHKYPTKFCGPFLSGLTCPLANCRIFPAFSKGLLYASQRSRGLLSLVINLFLLAAVPFHVLLPNISH